MSPRPAPLIHIQLGAAMVAWTDRATTCCTDRPLSSPSGPRVVRPRDGFRPTSPHIDDGIRMEPPPSLAWATATIPDATAAELPPLEPPGDLDRSHGLRHAP